MFQRWVMYRLLRAPGELMAFPLSKASAASPRSRTLVTLSPIVSMEPFSGQAPPRNVSGRQCLYIPRETNAPRWDFVLHVPSNRALIFIQVSKITLREHDYIS